MSTNSNINVQKCCKCKKSRCLKLYCECFTAGLYCDEACSCQACLNTLEYEDTVEEARRKILQRNPFAFLPKIDYHIQPPRNHRLGGDQLIPIAGKHKTGCNCRKSMCQQKYCECYQASIGCTDGCRCEGCENTYGKKIGSAVHSKLNDPDKKEMESVRLEYSPREFHIPQNSTPWTPVQHSDLGSNTSTTRRYIPSSGSDNNDMIFNTRRGNFDMVPSLYQQLHPNVEYMNQVTPPDTPDINSTSMMNLPSMGWQQRSQVISNFSSVSSLHYRGLPVSTPVFVVGGPKLNDSMEKRTETAHNNTPNIRSD